LIVRVLLKLSARRQRARRLRAPARVYGDQFEVQHDVLQWIESLTGNLRKPAMRRFEL
jgi:hypothetical protein